MGALRAIVSEVIHLFVDDGSLALALAGWCAVIGLSVAFLPGLATWSGLALFLGCSCVLLVNVAIAGRRHEGTKRSR